MLNNDEVWTLHRKASITRNVLLETHLYPFVEVLVTLGRVLLMVLWGCSTGADSSFSHKLSLSWATTACLQHELWIVPVPGHQPHGQILHGHAGCLSGLVSVPPHFHGLAGWLLDSTLPWCLTRPALPTMPRHHNPAPWLSRHFPLLCSACLPSAYTQEPGCSHLRNTSTLSHGTGGEQQQQSTVKGALLRLSPFSVTTHSVENRVYCILR